MAGEIADPYSIRFQADFVHSGSISFGRYENESLSWERRSSFSHNRYLEEVEKCSKPGSVSEKKAYFEAHFKKKVLRYQNSSESQNDREYQTSANGASENTDYREEYENLLRDEINPNGRNQFNYVVDGSNSAEFEDIFANVDYSKELDTGNKDGKFCLEHETLHSANYEDSPKWQEHHEEYKVAACISENSMLSFSEPENITSLNNSKNQVDCFPHDVNRETNHNELFSDQLLVDRGETEMGVKQRFDESVVNFVSSTPASYLADKVTLKKVETGSLELSQADSHKVAMEIKSVRPKLKSPVSNISIITSSDASKSNGMNSTMKEKHSSQRTNVQKLPSPSSIKARGSVPRNSKKEDSRMTNAKSSVQTKSGKAIRLKNGPKPQSYASNDETKAHSLPKRFTDTVALAKLDIRTSAASLDFKRHEEAETKNESSMTSKKQIQPKEIERIQVQAITQEKKKAEIKTVRRSVNFRGTPMPYFYTSGGQPASLVSKTLLKCKPANGKDISSGRLADAGIVRKKEQGKIQNHDNSKMKKDDKAVGGKVKVKNRCRMGHLVVGVVAS